MLGVLLSLCKKLHRYRDQQHRALWQPLGEVRAVAGMTVLVVGLGDIGREFARRVKAMGAFVIGVRRRGTEKPDYVDELRLTDSSTSCSGGRRGGPLSARNRRHPAHHGTAGGFPK